MRLADYDGRDGKKVWLEQDELDALIDEAQKPTEEVALLLAGKCGLRRKEIADVTPADLVETHGHFRVRVWEGKGDKYREVPAPERLARTINTLAYDLDPDAQVIQAHETTTYDWVRRAAERRYAATEDDGWQYLDVHDLRRTWGTYLVGQGVLPTVVMAWGGWESWDVFRNHYIGEMSPEVDKREQEKVPWLSDGTVDLGDAETHTMPVSGKSWVGR